MDGLGQDLNFFDQIVDSLKLREKLYTWYKT